MMNYEKANVQGVYNAKTMNDALKAFEHCCEQCLAHRCSGQACAGYRALENITHRGELQNEMKNPTIRERVLLALE